MEPLTAKEVQNLSNKVHVFTVEFTVSGVQDIPIKFPDGSGVNSNTPILASICELTQPNPGQPRIPHIGDFSMTVHNIVPRDDNAVTIRIGVDDGPIWFRLSIVVFK